MLAVIVFFGTYCDVDKYSRLRICSICALTSTLTVLSRIIHFFCEGPGSCQQLHISQTEAGSPEAAPVLIDLDLMSTPSKAGHVNGNVDVLANQDKSPLKIDLRSEAKMAAEVRSTSISEIYCVLVLMVFFFMLYCLFSIWLVCPFPLKIMII